MITAEQFLDMWIEEAVNALPPTANVERFKAYTQQDREFLLTMAERVLPAIHAAIQRSQSAAPEAPSAPPAAAPQAPPQSAPQWSGNVAVVSSTWAPLLPADHWTPGARHTANLRAMAVAATKKPMDLTPEDRKVLAGYSGWGGLDLGKAEAKLNELPANFPKPDPRAMLDEYYTPTEVVKAVADSIRQLVPTFPTAPDGSVLSLEPSAGIGRFIRAVGGAGFEALKWTAVELSPVSARILQLLRPDVQVFEGSFERWAHSHEGLQGQYGLVLSNPPYGARGVSKKQDPGEYEKIDKVHTYFMLRSLPFLAAGGLGVYTVPSQLMTAKGEESTRRTLLRSNHLSAAFRLPSGLFPGLPLTTVIDVWFMRARGGTLTEIDSEDQFIVDGDYFRKNPTHILGTEIGEEERDGKRTRFEYSIKGEFRGFPKFDERPLCSACSFVAPKTPSAPKKGRRTAGGKLGVADVRESLSLVTAGTEGALRDKLTAAVLLGNRVDLYLADLAAGGEDHIAQWAELHDALKSWLIVYKVPPAKDKDLSARSEHQIIRLQQAFAGKDLAPEFATKPVFVGQYPGGATPDAVARTLFTRAGRDPDTGVTLEEIQAEYARHVRGGQSKIAGSEVVRVMGELVRAGSWCVAGVFGRELMPAQSYYVGALWPRLEALEAIIKAHPPGSMHLGLCSLEHLKAQAQKLRDLIGHTPVSQITLSPQLGWIPLPILQSFMEAVVLGIPDNKLHMLPNGYQGLERVNGLVGLKGFDYADLLDKLKSYYNLKLFLGYLNHDMMMFRPRLGEDAKKAEIDAARIAKAQKWNEDFTSYVMSDIDRATVIEAAYARAFLGYVEENYGGVALAAQRWRTTGEKPVVLWPHQQAGAARLVKNRGGLLAFDVGLGKTYTGIMAMAKAREEGWAKRPVIVVPNTILWKWVADIQRALPDYRVVVIGSTQIASKKKDKQGNPILKGRNDTPAERGAKWTAFQAGQYDVAVVSYSAFGRTQLNVEAVADYTSKLQAVLREMKMTKRHGRVKNDDEGKTKSREAVIEEMVMAAPAKDREAVRIAYTEFKKKLSPRQLAALDERLLVWMHDILSINSRWEYDHGVTWDNIGVDFLMVDEAQNFKNLYKPSAREGGVPKFMGNEGPGSKRSWHLDLRAATVRKRSGGKGIFLLSATPAKNSPLEFYNLLQYIDPEVWERQGIRNPEMFIDNYINLEIRLTIGIDGMPERRSCAVGFQNMDELRSVIFRYADFKVPEDLPNIKLPKPNVHLVEVQMSPDQEAVYAGIAEEISLDLGMSSETHAKVIKAQDRIEALREELSEAENDDKRKIVQGKLDVVIQKLKEIKEKAEAEDAAQQLDLKTALASGNIEKLKKIKEKADKTAEKLAADPELQRIKAASMETIALAKSLTKDKELDIPTFLEKATKQQLRLVYGSKPEGKGGRKDGVLGKLARLSMVSIHQALNIGLDFKDAEAALKGDIKIRRWMDKEGNQWKPKKGEGKADRPASFVETEIDVKKINPHSAKIDACARNIMANRTVKQKTRDENGKEIEVDATCGHIIFVDNVAAHIFIRAVLVEAGVPHERIAILNAEAAPTSDARMKIAGEFNGDESAGKKPLYDVVIANAVAYEGIDLQVRTCSIHNIDLPWEFATLQQRNGRGVRQGNTLESVSIYYYFALRSMDGLRYTLIEGKRSWLISLLKSQDRATNNPGAQSNMDGSQVMMLVSKNPTQTELLLIYNQIASYMDDEARKIARAVSMFNGVGAMVREARRLQWVRPERANAIFEDAAGAVSKLNTLPDRIWPWKHAHQHLLERTAYAYMPKHQKGDAPPLPFVFYEGQRLLYGSPIEKPKEFENRGGMRVLKEEEKPPPFIRQIKEPDVGAGTFAYLGKMNFDGSNLKSFAMRYVAGGGFGRASVGWQDREWLPAEADRLVYADLLEGDPRWDVANQRFREKLNAEGEDVVTVGMEDEFAYVIQQSRVSPDFLAKAPERYLRALYDNPQLAAQVKQRFATPVEGYLPPVFLVAVFPSTGGVMTVPFAQTADFFAKYPGFVPIPQTDSGWTTYLTNAVKRARDGKLDILEWSAAAKSWFGRTLPSLPKSDVR